jgi:glycosyltransferase involved in cell wall biosynthesis
MVNHYAITPDMPGGSRHFELASLLGDEGWQTSIFATPFTHHASAFARDVSLRHPVANECVDGVELVWLYTSPYDENNWRRYLNMLSFVPGVVLAGSLRRRPHVIIGSSPHLLAPFAAWIVARRHRVPFVLEVRDLWPESLVQLGLSNRRIVAALEWMERFLYRKADLIVPLTEGIRTGILKKGVAPDKLVLVSNAAMRPKPLDPMARSAMRETVGWSDKVVAVWIGAHGPANGLNVLVDAARLLRDDPCILIVAIGEGSEKPALMEAAKGLPNIQFLDPVPKTDVDRWLRAADIGLLVHRDTGAVKGARPNKLFDYMAAGLPILDNMDGEARSLMEAAGAGVYVPAEDAAALARALQDLARSPERRQAYGLSGHAHVSRAHSREDSALILARALDRTLGGS